MDQAGSIGKIVHIGVRFQTFQMLLECSLGRRCFQVGWFSWSVKSRLVNSRKKGTHGLVINCGSVNKVLPPTEI